MTKIYAYTTFETTANLPNVTPQKELHHRKRFTTDRATLHKEVHRELHHRKRFTKERATLQKELHYRKSYTT